MKARNELFAAGFSRFWTACRHNDICQSIKLTTGRLGKTLFGGVFCIGTCDAFLQELWQQLPATGTLFSDLQMKRFFTIAVVAAGLTLGFSASPASAFDNFHGGYGGHHGGHGSYVHSGYAHGGGHGYSHGGYGYSHGQVQSYAPDYGYHSGYGHSSYGYQPSYRSGYAPSYDHGHGRGLHLDIGNVHVLGRGHGNH
jgi:hypothetical protein